MVVDNIPAHKLRTGMVIVPALRTMRHALIEKTNDLDLITPDILPRNHDDVYVIAHTDIGIMSFRSNDYVNVLVAEKGS